MPTLTQSAPSGNQINAPESVPLFTRIQIQTVSWCNRSCVFCPSGKFPVEKVFMPVEVYHRIIKQLQALNYAGAAKTALLLLAVSYGVLLLVYAMNRKVWAVWPQK